MRDRVAAAGAGQHLVEVDRQGRSPEEVSAERMAKGFAPLRRRF
jgi:hypothetical protein